MTLLDLQIELENRGVLGLHLSLVGGRYSFVAITATDDADAAGPSFEAAAHRLLQQLPTVTNGCGNA